MTRSRGRPRPSAGLVALVRGSRRHEVRDLEGRDPGSLPQERAADEARVDDDGRGVAHRAERHRPAPRREIPDGDPLPRAGPVAERPPPRPVRAFQLPGVLLDAPPVEVTGSEEVVEGIVVKDENGRHAPGVLAERLHRRQVERVVSDLEKNGPVPGGIGPPRLGGRVGHEVDLVAERTEKVGRVVGDAGANGGKRADETERRGRHARPPARRRADTTASHVRPRIDSNPRSPIRARHGRRGEELRRRRADGRADGRR